MEDSSQNDSVNSFQVFHPLASHHQRSTFQGIVDEEKQIESIIDRQKNHCDRRRNQRADDEGLLVNGEVLLGEEGTEGEENDLDEGDEERRKDEDAAVREVVADSLV